MSTETRMYTITGDKGTLERFEGLMNLLHWASAFGHSGRFGIPLDGDGQALFEIESPRDRQAASDVFGVGYDVELGLDKNFSGVFIDRKRKSKWNFPRDSG